MVNFTFFIEVDSLKMHIIARKVTETSLAFRFLSQFSSLRILWNGINIYTSHWTRNVVPYSDCWPAQASHHLLQTVFFLSPVLWLGGTIRMGLFVRSSIPLFICHTFVVSTHLQTNRSGDWYQTWWIHSLWYSTYLISLWLCYTEFLLFSGVWFMKHFPHIFRHTTEGICIKLGGYV